MDNIRALLTPVEQACRKSYTATRKSLHAFDFSKFGYFARVDNVSRVISNSSSEIMLWTLFGSIGVVAPSGGGVMVVAVVLMILLGRSTWAVCLRFRDFDLLMV